MLQDQATRVGAVSSRVPAKGFGSYDLGMQFDGLLDVRSLDCLFNELIIQPAVTVAGNIPVGVQHRLNNIGVSGKGNRDAINGDG